MSLRLNNFTSNSTPYNFQLPYFAAKVKDVILDSSHPEYLIKGNDSSVGAIKFIGIDTPLARIETSELKIAYPINSNNYQLPLKEEIVIIFTVPSDMITQPILGGKTTATVYGYITLLSIWNTPNHNAVKDPADETKLKLGWEFKEDSNIKPLQPYPGDIITTGRQGQSIRMSGTKYFLNNLTDDSNNGAPFTIISNGKGVDKKTNHIVEDINRDESSIYLVSDHVVPLKQARDKAKAWKKPPTRADTYQGSQVMVNGGRLYFNSKDESILFSSKEAFGVTANTVNLDAKEYIALDAEKIYLGEKALVEEYEPVLLGESTEQFFSELLYNLIELSKDLVKAKTIDGKIIPNLILRGKLLEAGMKSLQAQINPGGKSQLKSRKVFTE